MYLHTVGMVILSKLSSWKNPFRFLTLKQQTQSSLPEVLRRITDCIRVWSKTWVSKNGSGNIEYQGSFGSLVQIIQICFETSWASLLCSDCIVHTYEILWPSRCFKSSESLKFRKSRLFATAQQFHLALHVLSHSNSIWVFKSVYL